MKRTGRPEAHPSFVCLLGLAIVAVSACARPVAVDQVVVADVIRDLGVVYEQINGTPKQRRAGELVQYHLYQDPIVECMASKEFRYTSPPFVDMYAGYDDLRGLPGTWYAELNESSLGVAESAVRPAPFEADVPNPGVEQLDKKGKERYDDALSGCTPTNTPDVYIPLSSSQQNAKLLKLFAELERRSEAEDAIETYRICMRDSRLPVDNPDQLIEQVQQRFSKVPRDAVGDVNRPEWTAALEHERTAAAVDARCRRPVREILTMLMSAELPRFTDEHRSGIQRAQSNWEQLVAQAAKYPEAAALGLR